MSAPDPAALVRAATAAHGAGRLDEAEEGYRACLAANPADAEALHGWGWLRVQRGDWAGGLRRFGEALRITPWEPELWISQIEALLQLGQVEAVHRVLHRARANGLDPARVEAFEARLRDGRLSYLAEALKASGKRAEQAMQPPQSELLALRQAFLDRRFDEAREKARHLLKRYPLSAFGWRVMALVTPLADDPEFAMLSRRLACELDPEGVDATMNLALALHEAGRFDEAEGLYAGVLARQPDNVRALVNHGLLQNARNDPRAIDTLRRARALGADDFRVALALGGYLRDHDQPEEAIPLLEEALAKQPDSRMTAAALSVCYLGVGRHEEAATLFHRVDVPDAPDLHALGIVLFVATHLKEVDAAALFGLHRRYGEALEAQASPPAPHPNDRDPDRRLRVGFVSGDFRTHAMANFLLPMWQGLDRERIAIHAFHNHTANDAMTAELRALAEGWYDIIGLGNEEVADLVRRQRIDVLVDLSGHTGHHRLGVFAMKPAPVQISWAGYPATTGLSRMDYYMLDTTYAPPGRLDEQFTERLLRMPANSSFTPGLKAPEVAPLPSLAAESPFTFGSFNRMSKLTPATLDLWGRLMATVPGSRLLVGAADAPNIERLRRHLGGFGIEDSRIEFLPRLGLSDYLAAHARTDLLLDTYPYAGGTTTCFALWMGVPTLTLAGDTLPSRTGVAIMGRIGLWDFVAEDEASFVRQGAAWADPSRRQELAALRSSLRARFAASDLGSPRVAIEGFEDAVRAAWGRWCRDEPPAPIVIPRRSA